MWAVFAIQYVMACKRQKSEQDRRMGCTDDSRDGEIRYYARSCQKETMIGWKLDSTERYGSEMVAPLCHDTLTLYPEHVHIRIPLSCSEEYRD